MNVEGMTRENVASHLQKFRQQLKRADGWSGPGQVRHHAAACSGAGCRCPEAPPSSCGGAGGGGPACPATERAGAWQLPGCADLPAPVHTGPPDGHTRRAAARCVATPARAAMRACNAAAAAGDSRGRDAAHYTEPVRSAGPGCALHLRRPAAVQACSPGAARLRPCRPCSPASWSPPVCSPPMYSTRSPVYLPPGPCRATRAPWATQPRGPLQPLPAEQRIPERVQRFRFPCLHARAD